MLWRRRCCYVEDVAMLKMLLRWRCWRCLYVEDVQDVAILKMLLRWGCCYVEGVFMLKMLKMLLCWKKGMCISPVVLRGIMTFLLDPWRHWNSISTQFYWFLRKQHKVKNLKNLKLVKTADNIPRAEVVQCVIMFHEDHKTLQKRSETWHVQIFLQLHFNCTPGILFIHYIYISPYITISYIILYRYSMIFISTMNFLAFSICSSRIRCSSACRLVSRASFRSERVGTAELDHLWTTLE